MIDVTEFVGDEERRLARRKETYNDHLIRKCLESNLHTFPCPPTIITFVIFKVNKSTKTAHSSCTESCHLSLEVTRCRIHLVTSSDK